MLKEVRVLTEGLSTFLTRVRFLPGVDFLVPRQFGVIPEGFPTFFAFVGLLTSVNSLMLMKVCMLVEIPATLTAFIMHLFSREALLCNEMCANTTATFQLPGYPFSFDGRAFIILDCRVCEISFL